jgi:2,4-dienoyl-CoA reductase-like NADH-dependent reductase (Old Yellow Enzyme family)
MPFPLLAAPLRIGPHTARNRVVFGAHFTRFTEPNGVAGEPGLYGARLGRYLAERAAGGAAVVIAGQAAVHPTTAYQMPNNAAAWRPEAVAGFEAVTAPVHEHGALAFIQLSHNGGVNDGAWSKLPVWAPSAVANYFEPPKPLEKHEIRELVEHFAVSAANAAAGGFDGIEVHAAHGYLIHEFLSPTSNRRTDEYGGPLENRMRFAVEVLSEIRDRVGDEVAVGVRLVGDEEHWDGSGLGPEAVGEIAARLEQLGLVDFLNVSVGTSGIGMVRPMYVPHAFAAATTGVIKAAVGDTPVLAVHRIVTPGEAEAILEAGQADAVTVVRALIADPDWTNKALTGADDEIRPCTGCNQGCYGNLTAALPVTCATNPAVGREAELGGPLPAAPTSRRVVVVGGGPAGLEAAWVAAARGHEVTLLERDVELGGGIRAAATLPGRGEMIGFVDWRIAECERRGVDVRLGVEADVDTVLGFQPDAVVVATGGDATIDAPSKWHPFPIPGAEGERVITHETALARADEIGGRVVVVDGVGFIDGIAVAEVLCERGAEVTVVMPLAQPMLADSETMVKALGRAARRGVRWRPNTVAGFVTVRDEVPDGGGPVEVTVFDTYSRASETLTADWLVVRTHGRPRDGLYHELRARAGSGTGPEVVRVGDAVAVRWVDRAVFDGHRVGRSL